LRIAGEGGIANFLKRVPCTTTFLHAQGKHRAGRGKFKQRNKRGFAVRSSKMIGIPPPPHRLELVGMRRVKGEGRVQNEEKSLFSDSGSSSRAGRAGRIMGRTGSVQYQHIGNSVRRTWVTPFWVGGRRRSELGARSPAPPRLAGRRDLRWGHVMVAN
jgi:hypothetical protein